MNSRPASNGQRAACVAEREEPGNRGLRGVSARARIRAEDAELSAMDFAKVHQEWLDNLREFAEAYPNSPDTAEAMLALRWPTNSPAKKTRQRNGMARSPRDSPSRRRLARPPDADTPRLRWQRNPFQGQSPSGETCRPGRLPWQSRGHQYWASWCEPCKADMAALKDLAIRYGKSGFQVDRGERRQQLQEMKSYLAEPSAVATDSRAGRARQPAGQ